MTTVLMAGATGLLGSALVEALLERRVQGEQIRLMLMSRSEKNVPERWRALSDVELLFHDIRQPLPEGLRPDYIVHAASECSPGAFRAAPLDVMEANTLGTANLLNLARQAGSRSMVYVSSGEVYGAVEPVNGGITEDMRGLPGPLTARSCYPDGKRAGEALCVCAHAQHGVPVKIVRPCHLFGPVPTNVQYPTAVQEFLMRAAAGQPITLKSPGTQLRSYCHALDAAKAVLTALFHGENGEAYNVADPSITLTVRGLAEQIASLAEPPVPVLHDYNPAVPVTGITYAVLNPAKLQSLGWRPSVALRDGIRSTLKP